jgi:hypothetical protein
MVEEVAMKGKVVIILNIVLALLLLMPGVAVAQSSADEADMERA